MTSLIVRNLNENIVVALKQRAVRHGKSAEAEHRVLLEEVLLRPKGKSFAEALVPCPMLAEMRILSAWKMWPVMTVVTRNHKDFVKTGVRVLNPFTS